MSDGRRAGAAGERHGIHSVGAAAQLACLLEACAPKPGNVSPGRDFGDTRFEDFLASAAAIGGPLSASGARPIGVTVRSAVEATRQWSPANTNLGIVLVLTPLACAAHACLPDGMRGEPGSRGCSALAIPADDLRLALRRVLDATTVDDARDVYAAIRLAAPGGLGTAETEDVASDPTLPLVDVMRLAAARDGVAHEYATSFAVTFEQGTPVLTRARADGLDWNDAIVETFLTLLAARPDTHIVRRAGFEVASDASRRAAEALARGGVRSQAGRRTIDEMDRALRDPRNRANPGTTADLTAAAVYVVLLGGGWRRA